MQHGVVKSHPFGQCPVLVSIYKKGGMEGVIIHETCTLRKAKYELSKAAFGYFCFMYMKMDLSLMRIVAWGLWNTLTSAHQNCFCTPPSSSALSGREELGESIACVVYFEVLIRPSVSEKTARQMKGTDVM